MIIRYTLKDNDTIDIIKNFYKHIKFDNDLWLRNESINYNNYDELKDAIINYDKFDDLFKKCLFEKEKITKNEINELNKLLKCKFDFYLTKIGKESLINNVSIEIVDVVYDKNYNGEYIYYFVGTDQIIIL